MLRPVLLVLLAQLARATIVEPSSLADRLDQLYEKLDKFSSKPNPPILPERLEKIYEKLEKFSAPQTTERNIDRLYEKLDRLNSLTPDKYFSDDDEELVDAMQEWGMPDEQIGTVVKDLQRMKNEEDYSEWNEEDLQELVEDDYPMDDGSDDAEIEEEEGTTARALKMAPSALSRVVTTVESAAELITATKERPKILIDAAMSKAERVLLRRAAIANMAAVVQHSRCLTPQPRWLSVRQLAPAADTLYMPPCVQLHRCAPDAGCCYSEAEVCAPVDGQHVTIPFFLSKVDGNLTLARMQFFNHTRCECVSRETLQTTPIRMPRRDLQERVQPRVSNGNDIQGASQESAGNARQSDVWPTQEPRIQSETEAPPQLRRCTCPILFMARLTDNGCSCVCEWPDLNRRRDCLSLARGREHFGLRDRVCVANGDCNPPTCEYGAYDKHRGRCPVRKYRRFRFTTRRFPDRVVD